MSALTSSPFSGGFPGGPGSFPGGSAGAGGPLAGQTTFGFSIPQGNAGELDAAAARAAGASIGFGSRAQDVSSAVGAATAGWAGAAESAFVGFAGRLKAVLSGNAEVMARASQTLSTFARELEHAQLLTRQAAAQCQHYQSELTTQQGLAQLHGGNAQTLYAQAAIAAHPQVQGQLVKQAQNEAGIAHQAALAAAAAQREFDSWQKRGRDADATYTQQADSAARQIAGLAGELRPAPVLAGGGAPLPITVTPADLGLARSMLPAILAMPGSAWSENPGGQLAALNGGRPLTPAQVAAVYEVVKAEQAGGQGSLIDGLGGYVHAATLGLVSFGNSDTARYQGGALAALIPLNPDSLLVDGERAGVKVTDTVIQDGSETTGLATRTGIGVDRGDGRDITGKFTGQGGYGAGAEQRGLAQYAQRTGEQVIPTHVRATIPGYGNRYYDGLVRNPDGTYTGVQTYTGVEVKSGSASLSTHQRTFDNAVDSGQTATATLDGQPIHITRTVLVKVSR